MQLKPLLAVWLALELGAQAAPASAEDQQFWAFQKPCRPEVPAVRQLERARTPVDSFLLSKLEERGLGFSSDADRATLLRRAFLDLVGLPPGPEEVEAFAADVSPDAYERLLDRLLASPRFGERWGRHWLDVVGYVDTVGFDHAPNEILLTQGKWRYRDWVIRALNEDRPYDRFVSEQLAGDEMVDWRRAEKLTPEIQEKLIATGFLRTARDESHEPESNIPLIFYGVLHDTVEIVGSSLLGLTLNCARCHNHKFDPIPQEDYYRLMAVFTPAYNPRAWKPVHPWKPEIVDRGLPDVSATERKQIERHNGEIERQTAAREKALLELRRPYRSRLFEEKLGKLPEPIRADTRTALETPGEKRSEVQKYLAGKFESALQVKPEELTAAMSDEHRAAEASLVKEVAALGARRLSFGKIQALYDVGPPPPTHLLQRGSYETPGPVVEPGFLRVLCDPETGAPAPGEGPEEAAEGSSGRRTALARRLTRPGSRAAALLSRVMVNRVWQHLFGQGIVPTPENLGVGGERPSHPELLEWLSSELMEGGWRLKPLLKLLMTSSAYRQSSRREEAPGAAAGGPGPGGGAERAADPEELDPSNQLLYRMRLRRLESEVIRDSILAVSGRLDGTMGGPPVLLEARSDGMVTVSEKRLETPSARWRRSVYLLCRRTYNLSFLSVFDQPQVATTCARRDASAVPLQSLTLLNDAFLSEEAEHFSRRVARMAGSSAARRVAAAFELALGRAPTAAEERLCLESLEGQAALYQKARLAPAEASEKALAQLCLTLFNTSEFLYAE